MSESRSPLGQEEHEAWLAMIQRGYEESVKTYEALPWVFGERMRRERLEREGGDNATDRA